VEGKSNYFNDTQIDTLKQNNKRNENGSKHWRLFSYFMKMGVVPTSDEITMMCMIYGLWSDNVRKEKQSPNVNSFK